MFAVCDELADASQAARFCGHFRYEGASTLSHKSPVSRTATGIPVALFNIANDPEELHDVAAEQQEVVQRMLARLDKERSSEWHEPQWEGTNACDTPDGSCKPRHLAYSAAALRKGCLNSFLDESATMV